MIAGSMKIKLKLMHVINMIDINEWVEMLKFIRSHNGIASYDYRDILKTELGCCVFRPEPHTWACVCIVENNRNHLKIMKKVPFSSCIQEAHI